MSELFPTATVLQSKGRLLDVSSPIVMGILNATPDSFYNKGRNSDLESLLIQAEQMLKAGASILDIGGASSKPGQPLMPPQQELERIIPVVEAIHNRFPDAWLSVDTYNSMVARHTILAGASIINDISSGAFDENMFSVVAALKVPYIAMHIQGVPEIMQKNPQYHNVVIEVRNSLSEICNRCSAAGIKDVIIDPGFGFGKTVAHNFQLLNYLHTFRILGRPILVGLSRKSIVCRTLNIEPENALNGTTALNMVAISQGANIIRVHDVKEAVEVVKLFTALKRSY